jgi:hypothetical protein
MKKWILPAIVLLAIPLYGCASKTQATGVTRYVPTPGTNEIDMDKVRALLPEYRSKSRQQLGAAQDETDFNRRAAASYVVLEQAGVPLSAEGVGVVESQYLDSLSNRAYGFSLLGHLASLDIGKRRIQRIVMDFVERNPYSRDCDAALWALGETGDSDAFAEFLRIAADTDRYGPVARERSFCCVSQCGRYSMTTRYEEIPKIIAIGRGNPEAQTQQWCLMALNFMAPGAGCATLDQWQKWWEQQSTLRPASGQ